MRIRYDKRDEFNCPKNTLVTHRVGDYIYWGISRCNKEASDRFSKKTGKMIADARASFFLDIFDPSESEEEFVVGESLMYGRCKKEKIRDLLEHFKNIDRIKFELRGQKQ